MFPPDLYVGPRAKAPETPAERLGLYAATLRRWWWLLASIVAVALLAGVVVAKVVPKSYLATSKVLVDQQKQVDALLGTEDVSPDPERELNTNLALITLEPIADSVRHELRLDMTAAELITNVETEVEQTSNVLAITARNADPALSARIANAFATGYRDFRTRSARASLNEAIASARRRLSGRGPGGERDDLRDELRRLENAAAFETGGVQVVRRATASTAVARPALGPAAAVAGLLGLLLAAVTAFVLARTDKRLRVEQDLETAIGRPVTVQVPGSNAPGRVAGAGEGLLTLAISLSHPGRALSAPSAILVTSPGPHEGAADVALGLAHAFGVMGRRTIAIEADLREPSFAARLEIEACDGLAAIVAGRRTLHDELVEIECPERRGGARAWALPAGPAPVSPQAVLADGGVAAIVEEARRRFDMVLITAAPAGLVGDSLALVPFVDSVMLVARLDVTRVDEAVRAVRALEGVEAPLGDVVVTTRRRRRRGLRSARTGIRSGRRGVSEDRPARLPGKSAGAPGHRAATPSETTVP